VGSIIIVSVHTSIVTMYINEALFIEVDVDAAFKQLGSQVLIETDGISLTSYKFNVSHHDVFI